MSTDPAQQELENNAEVRRHCPDCFVPSHDVKRGHLDVAVPESCSDEECLCHTPLKVNVVDQSKVTAKFG